MIPKIVHYCWFSGEPYPVEIQRCIDSWHKYLPDYEFRLWDMNAVKDIDTYTALNRELNNLHDDLMRIAGSTDNKNSMTTTKPS